MNNWIDEITEMHNACVDFMHESRAALETREFYKAKSAAEKAVEIEKKALVIVIREKINTRLAHMIPMALRDAVDILADIQVLINKVEGKA